MGTKTRIELLSSEASGGLYTLETATDRTAEGVAEGPADKTTKGGADVTVDGTRADHAAAHAS